jgi:hypothetical protein
MKLKSTFFKLSFICLISAFSYKASAQTINAPTDLQITGGNANAIFCPTNAVKLQASPNDGTLPAKPFTSYVWSRVNSNSGADVITGQTGNILSLTNETPGYHTYRVNGIIDNLNGAVCQSDAYEDFTVFVLPALTPNALVTGTPSLNYCANNATNTGITLKATPTFTTALEALPTGITGVQPTIGDFGLTYKWTKINTVGNVETVITSATTDTYVVNDTEVGTFKYKVEVVYNVKTGCGPYSAIVQSGASDAVINVTAAPGKPTITILP